MEIKQKSKQMEKFVQLFRSLNYRPITLLIINTTNENNKFQTYLIPKKSKITSKQQNGFH